MAQKADVLVAGACPAGFSLATTAAAWTRTPPPHAPRKDWEERGDARDRAAGAGRVLRICKRTKAVRWTQIDKALKASMVAATTMAAGGGGRNEVGGGTAMEIYGALGLASMSFMSYLVVATNASLVARLPQGRVLRVRSLSLSLSRARSLSHTDTLAHALSRFRFLALAFSLSLSPLALLLSLARSIVLSCPSSLPELPLFAMPCPATAARCASADARKVSATRMWSPSLSLSLPHLLFLSFSLSLFLSFSLSLFLSSLSLANSDDLSNSDTHLVAISRCLLPDSMEDERAIDDKEFGHIKDITAGWGLLFSPDFDMTQTQQRVTLSHSLFLST